MVDAIRSHSPLPADTSSGILFVGFLVLAVVIMSSRSGSYSGDLNRFLLGSIPAVDRADLVRQDLAATLAVFRVVLFYRTFLVSTFDEILARLFARRVPVITAAAIVDGSVAVVVGLLISYHYSTAAGATMALTGVVILAGVLVARSLLDALPRSRPALIETREVVR